MSKSELIASKSSSNVPLSTQTKSVAMLHPTAKLKLNSDAFRSMKYYVQPKIQRMAGNSGLWNAGKAGDSEMYETSAGGIG